MEQKVFSLFLDSSARQKVIPVWWVGRTEATPTLVHIIEKDIAVFTENLAVFIAEKVDNQRWLVVQGVSRRNQMMPADREVLEPYLRKDY